MTEYSFWSTHIARLCALTAVVGSVACARARSTTELAPLPSRSGAGEETPATHGVSRSASPADDRRAEFEYRRLHSASGQFITEQELARGSSLPLLDVLRMYLRGFGNFRDGSPGADDLDDRIDVYLNGLRVSSIGGIRAGELMGVEYYQAAGAPVKYRRAFSSAPVLLLWLKR